MPVPKLRTRFVLAYSAAPADKYVPPSPGASGQTPLTSAKLATVLPEQLVPNPPATLPTDLIPASPSCTPIALVKSLSVLPPRFTNVAKSSGA